MSDCERRFAQLTRASVCLQAESDGHPALPDNVASLLAEDANYRLRQIIQMASQYMCHSNRKKLTTTDVNHALQWSQVEPLYGFDLPEPLAMVYVKEVDLFVLQDEEVNLMNVVNEPTPQGALQAPYVRSQWLAVEGALNSDVIKKEPSSESAESQAAATTASVNVPSSVMARKSPSVHQPPPAISEILMSYYDHVTQAVLGSDQEMLRLALEDLRTNDRLTPLLPYLLNFISVGVKKMGHDLTQLSKLLNSVRALISNNTLYLGTQPYLTVLVQSLLYCVLEPLTTTLDSSHDHWTFRDSAAKLLADILSVWSTSTNELWSQTGLILRDSLRDFTKSFSTHYGALVAIQAMGIQEVESLVLPQMETYWPHLLRGIEVAKPQVQSEAHRVRGILLLLSEHMLRWRLKQAFCEAWSERERDLGQAYTDGGPISPSLKHHYTHKFERERALGSCSIDSLTLYKRLYELLGDALPVCLPYLPYVRDLALPQIKNEIPSSALLQSGEELLETFYEGIEEETAMGFRSPANSMDEDNSYEENSPLSDEAPAVELQIRSTISDPALGIKLTIAKLRRDNTPTPTARDSPSGRKRKKASRDVPSEPFDRVPLRPPFIPLEFNFEGATPIPHMLLRRNTFWPTGEMPGQVWQIGLRMKKTGKKKATKGPVRRPQMSLLLAVL